MIIPLLNNSLLMDLDFEGDTGRITTNQSSQGNYNDGYLLNRSILKNTANQLNQIVTFNGDNNYLAIKNLEDINLGIHAKRTISLKFKVDDIKLTDRKQVIYEEGASTRGLNIYIDDGKLYVDGWNAVSTESNWQGTFLETNQIQSNTWHQATLVSDAQKELNTIELGVFKAYLDGSQLWSHGGVIGLGNVNGGTRFHDGSVNETATQGLAGSIDDVQLYNRVLTTTEIESSPSSIVGITIGTTYYVSPLGDDNNSGISIDQAIKTIAKLNTIDFEPGDRILFEGGATFNGNLALDQTDTGTSTNPITIGTYGIGKATINAGNGTGIYGYNVEGYQVSDLNIIGSGTQTNQGEGISFYTDLPNNIKLELIQIDNVDVSGFLKAGISIGAWNQKTGYRNVSVTNSTTHHNGHHGLITYAQSFNTHENVYISHVKAHDNWGIAGEQNPSGNGIVLGNVDTGIIEYSLAYNNGKLDNTGVAPVGIWTYDSTKITIQHNESYNNRTGTHADGGGFDLDQNVSHSVLQYNYSHDNDGAGFLLFHNGAKELGTGNIVRYNISQNDGRKNSYAGIFVYGSVDQAQIYNNTVFISPAATGTPSAIHIGNQGLTNHDVSSLHIRNNIFQTTGGLPLVKVDASQLNGATDILFQGNNYYSSNQAFKIRWGSQVYRNLANWRTATRQEMLGSQPVGTSVNPQLYNAGGGTTLGNFEALSSLELDAYRLKINSPLINTGLNLKSLFGLEVGAQDFYGSPLPQGLGYDVGAYEFPF